MVQTHSLDHLLGNEYILNEL